MRPKAFSPVLLYLSFSYFLTAAELSFAQRASGQGLKAEISRVKIPRNRRPVVTFKISDSKGKPLTIKDLDRRGIPFIIATIKVGKNGETSYHNYVLQKVKGKDYVYKGEKKKPVLAETLQPDRDRHGKFVKQGKGVYNYTFRKALPANFDKNATHVVGGTLTRGKRKYMINPLYEFVPSGGKVSVRTSAPRPNSPRDTIYGPKQAPPGHRLLLRSQRCRPGTTTLSATATTAYRPRRLGRRRPRPLYA